MKSVIVWLLLVALIVTGCSGKREGSSESRNASATEKALTDLSTYDVCALLSEDAVAQALGGAALEPARRNDYGSAQGCEYEIDPAGPDNYEYCAIWLMPPSSFGDSESALKTEVGLGEKATAEPLANLGDKAFVIHNETEQQSTIHILLIDRMAIEVKADRYEDARKLADLILSKLH